ncbi:MAG TPA: two-component regulator propeller domain-containing protein [Phnomibacter sp.]|nr:two-component regulator propeller domain-containing protein [Phnomibacter sp.]
MLQRFSIRPPAILVLFFLLYQSATAQPYYFRHYQVENGLSNNASVCCAQDKQGFIWIGTKDGLNRFDGYSFKVFRNNPADSNSIGSNFIHALYVDKKNTLWVGTEKGLYSYDESKEIFRLVKPSMNRPVSDVKMDSLGNIWYIQLFTLHQYNVKENRLTVYPIAQSFEASSICTDRNGKLWVGGANGYLYAYNYQTRRFTPYNAFAKDAAGSIHWIERIYPTQQNELLIATANGAKIFDLATHDYKNILQYNTDKTEIFVRNFLEQDSASIWIASESGIYIYDRSTGGITNLRKDYNDDYSISDNAVYALCKDREGGTWAATYFGGINYISRSFTAFKKYFPKQGQNSLSGNIVREIHEDAQHNFWIGTEDAGLNKYNPQTGTFTAFQPNSDGTGIAYNNIHGMLVDGQKLWVGTFEHGLNVLDIPSGKVMKHYTASTAPGQLNSNFIFCITRSNSNKIWIGTTRGAFQYEATHDNFSVLNGLPLYNWYSYLLHDSHNAVWAATYGNGVFHYDSATNKTIHYSYNPSDTNSIASDRVNSIFEATNKTLWFATENGLCKFNPVNKSFKTYGVKDGMPSDFILNMLEDDQHALWISTSKGMVCFNPGTEQIITYTRNNGILNDQFNFNSAYKSKDGTMYFGSVKGMISFNPSSFTTNTFVPPVFITGFQVFNKEISINSPYFSLNSSITHTKKIVLNYDQSTISIDFAALSFAAPETNVYAYQLEGLEKKWTYLKKNRKAYFTELVPGTYLFKVKAGNSSGLWNRQITYLEIVILPPWWKSNLAYLIYTILFLLTLAFIIYQLHKTGEARNKRKYELLEIAKEKEVFEAKIDFFTNVAHEIKTPLTLIKAPLEKVIKKAGMLPEISNHLGIMERNTNRLIELSNQLLDFRQTEIKGYELNFVKANINQLLTDTFNSFKPLAEEKELSFSMSLPPQPVFAFVDLDALSKILYNLLSNAVKYANAHVDVQLNSVAANASCFSVEIANDGHEIPTELSEKIFEPFYRIKASEKLRGTGIGLALSRSLAQLHNGSLVLQKPGTNKLNIFVLSLPIHQKFEFTLNSISSKSVS